MRRTILFCSLISIIANSYVSYAAEFVEDDFWKGKEPEREQKDRVDEVVTASDPDSNAMSRKRPLPPAIERAAKKSRSNPDESISEASDEIDKTYDESEDAEEALSQDKHSLISGPKKEPEPKVSKPRSTGNKAPRFLYNPEALKAYLSSRAMQATTPLTKHEDELESSDNDNEMIAEEDEVSEEAIKQCHWDDCSNWLKAGEFKAHLEQHVRISTKGAGGFACHWQEPGNICGKTFTSKDKLRIHMMCHAGERVLCTYSGCTATFANESSLRNHV